jgi:hypothetical protein
MRGLQHRLMSTVSGDQDVAGTTVPKQEELRPDENQLRGEADIYLFQGGT